ncbi:MAG: DUF4115 domain-containing protein [Acidobacteria bacterium]|nr:DUF4115 domain-containing protein [Acidobacteriota bacterium]
MGSFGENLRREREMRGVTLEEISAATKISVRFLKSIEDEDFSKLPGGLFNRSFVRAYARYLGLDEEPLIAEYQLAAKAKGEVDVTRLSLPVSHSSSSRDRRMRSHWIGVGASVVLLVVGYGLWRYSQPSKQLASPETAQVLPKKNLPSHRVTAPSSAATVSPGAVPSPESQSSPASSNKQAAATQPAQAGVAPATPAGSVPAAKAPANVDYADSLVLQVAATERAWVAVDADGKTVMQGIMSPNEVKTFKAKDSFDFLTGNAQGVTLTLNGQTLKPLGREGEVKSIHLTRDSVKNLTTP